MKSEYKKQVEYFLKYDQLEIIDRDWSDNDSHIDYVCIDDKQDKRYIVFIDVFITEGLSTEIEHKTQEEFEELITKWAKTSDYSDVGLRYDTLILKIFGGNKALVSHYIKVY